MHLKEKFVQRKLLMRKLRIICIIILLLVLSACAEPIQREPVVRETFSAQAVVTSYDEHKWYAGYAHHYRYTVRVTCKEYNLSKTFEDTVSGMWASSKLQGMKKGQTVNVTIVKETRGEQVIGMYITSINN